MIFEGTVLLEGPSDVGKTAMAISIAKEVAEKGNFVKIVCLESKVPEMNYILGENPKNITIKAIKYEEVDTLEHKIRTCTESCDYLVIDSITDILLAKTPNIEETAAKYRNIRNMLIELLDALEETKKNAILVVNTDVTEPEIVEFLEESVGHIIKVDGTHANIDGTIKEYKFNREEASIEWLRE